MIMRQKAIIFHPALATYRVDFFNEIVEEFDAIIYFEYREQFSKYYLSSKCNFTSQYLDKGFDLFGRGIRFGIYSIITKQKPDIIICSEYGSTTLMVLFLSLFYKKKHKIYTLSDDSLENAKQRSGLRSFVRKLVSKKIDGIIFTSFDVSKWYQINVSIKPKALVLPIIRNEIVFRTELGGSLKTGDENLKLFNLIDRKVILFVGRLEKEKNLSFLLNVVSKLKDNTLVLVIIGKGSLMLDLQKQALDLNFSERVHFLGNKEGNELLSWYNIAQLFILPSRFEPFGAVVNEALLGGCYVLCSELAGASSLITKENGDLFNPYKEQELLELVENYLKIINPIGSQTLVLRESKMALNFYDHVKAVFENL